MTLHESLRELSLSWRRVVGRFWLAVGHSLVVTGCRLFERGQRLVETPDDRP